MVHAEMSGFGLAHLCSSVWRSIFLSYRHVATPFLAMMIWARVGYTGAEYEYSDSLLVMYPQVRLPA